MQRVSFISLYDEYCLDLRYASSMLRRDGHATQIVLFKGLNDLGLQCEETEYRSARTYAEPGETSLLLQTLNAFKPNLVCVFFASAAYGLAEFLTQKIRQALKIPVLWAGPDSTFNPENNIRHADAICLGEAEYPIRFFVDHYDKNQDRTGTPSVWINQNERIFRNPTIGLETNLDKLPWPDFDPQNTTAIADDKIVDTPYPPGSPLQTNIAVTASRRCPFTCPYCQTGHDGIVYEKHEDARVRSVDSVIEELKHRLQTWPHAIERVEFHDRSMPLKEDWLREFAARYPTEIALPFYGFVRPSDAAEDAYRLLRQAGAFALVVRIPSRVPRVHKPSPTGESERERIIRTVRRIGDSGLQALCEPVVDNPFESDADRLETLRLLTELPPGFGVVDNAVPFAYYENCSIHKQAVREGLTDRFERPVGERALRAKPHPHHTFWNALYKLAQFEGIDKECLLKFADDEYLKEHPKTLREMVSNLYDATYVGGNPMAEKDRYVQYLRGRLMETQQLASKPSVRKIREIADVFIKR